MEADRTSIQPALSPRNAREILFCFDKFFSTRGCHLRRNCALFYFILHVPPPFFIHLLNSTCANFYARMQAAIIDALWLSFSTFLRNWSGNGEILSSLFISSISIFAFNLSETIMKQYIMQSMLCFLISSFSYVYAQPDIQSEHSLGGNDSELGYGIRQTHDSGFISIGFTSSTNGDVDGLHSIFYADIWLVKLDTAGEIEWQKCLGGSFDDYGYDIEITGDGGYIIAGSTMSDDGDVSSIHGLSDCWIIKTDSLGNIEWEKTYGGIESEEAYSIDTTADGGYIFGGRSSSNDGDVTGHYGDAFSSDAWLVKLNASGDIEWQKSLGGIFFDNINEVVPTVTGGYICIGYSDSQDGDVSDHHGFPGISDVWMIKLDSEGNMVWERSYGGSSYDAGNAILQTADGNYIFAASASSSDGDISDLHGDYDYWVVKTDTSGNILWEKTYGGSQQDEAMEICKTFSGGYFVSGLEYSDDGDVTGNHNGADYWALKIDSTGIIIWQNTLGGGLQDFATDGIQLNDGGYAMTGFSNSLNGDVSDNHNFNDVWVVRLESDCAVTSAAFTYSVTDGEVMFTDASVNAEEWLWDFGDGNTDTVQNPTHIFTSGGTYTVCLQTSGSCNTSSICTVVTIELLPENITESDNASFSLYPNPTLGITMMQLPESLKESAPLSLSNGIGQMIQTVILPAGTNIYSLDMLHFTPGIYYVSIFNSFINETETLIRE